VVFSKDRAMQLDACLRSIQRFAPYSGPITVLYVATTHEFLAGYQAIELDGSVRLVAQASPFRSAVMELMSDDLEYTVFHTDDDLFFARPPGQPVLPSGYAAFSLRLGENTIYSHPSDRKQRLPNASQLGQIMAWDWRRADSDFAYPMSLNGHIFSTSLLRELLSDASFDNPNELEAELHFRRYRAPRGLLAFRTSSVVSIPANVVTTTHANRASSDPESSPEALNRRFLAGERIDPERMDFSGVDAAHQEIDFAFLAGR
jgi:hypothetical protein